MPFFHLKRFQILAACLCLAWAGCGVQSGGAGAETDDVNFRRGQSYLRENRPREALQAFLKAAENRRDAPETHLELGRIYLDHFQDPVSAIYHFKKFLEFKPNAEESPLVRQLIETAEKEFIRHLKGAPLVQEEDRLKLLETTQRLKSENAELKKRLAAARRRLAGSVESGGAADSSHDADSRPATYTVQAGDTLSRISVKVYGTSARWRDIFEANRDILPGPHALKVGQVLTIP